MAVVRTKPVEVLSVEDNAADIAMLRVLLSKTHSNPKLTFLTDGVGVIGYLEACREQGTLPDLILLDLNLPKKDGREVLRELKSHPDFQSIPVLILSSSTRQEDINECYQSSANSFMSKPGDLDELERAITAFDLFWLQTVALPRSEAYR